MTPGKNEKYSLVGALHITTGEMRHCLGPRKNPALFRALWTLRDRPSPASRVSRVAVVVENYLSLSRLNHRLPGGETHPEVV